MHRSYESSVRHLDPARWLELLSAIDAGQETIRGDAYRGLKANMLVEDSLRSMQERSLDQDIPLSHQLDGSSYNEELLRKSLIPLVYAVYEQELDPAMDPIDLVKKMNEVLVDIINNALRLNVSYFESVGEDWGVSPIALSTIGDALIQPSLIRIASKTQRSYLDSWGKAVCPVCGRHTSTVVKSEAEPWRFKCSFCRAEYKMNIFSCPHCGSEGYEEKEFLLVGESREFEVASCSKCNRYYKIINRSKLKETIPEGREDIYTYFLDDIAHQKGLKRLDEIVPDAD